MKYAFTLAMVLLVSAVLISGCTTHPGDSGTSTGQLTQAQKESQALAAVDQEMEQSIGNMTLEDMENELLQQG